MPRAAAISVRQCHVRDHSKVIILLPVLNEYFQAIDSGVRKIVKVLKLSGLYDNSIIIFSSDNGGACYSCNYPLRGHKEQVYEGGVKAVSFVHSPLIRKSRKANSGKDWYNNC